MRVLYWMESLSTRPGGVQVLGFQAMDALRERGFDFTVVCSSTGEGLPEEEERNGIPVYRVPMLPALQRKDPLALLSARRRVAEIRERVRPDVAQVNFVGPTILFHLDAKGPPVPTVVALRLSLPEGLGGEGTLLNRALSSSAWVTANSRYVLDSILRAVPGVEDRASVVYNGLRIPDRTPSPPPFDPPSLLAIGRVVPEKGFDLAVEAFARLASDHPGLVLRIAGEGPARADLEERAQALGVRDRVEFLGWVPKDSIPALIDRSTLVVMPSRWEEAFGLVALEAALMARPAVVTRVGGLPEVVAEGSTGLVVPPEDPEALAGAVGRLLSDPTRLQRMGREARVRAVREFSLDAYVDAYAEIYHRVAREGARVGTEGASR